MRAVCPHCQAQYQVQDALRGRVATCAKCRERFLLGGEEPEAVIEAEEVPVESEFLVAEMVDEPRATMSPRREPAAPATIRTHRRRRKQSLAVPLMVIGGTGMVVLAIVGFVIYFLVTLNSTPTNPQQAQGPRQAPQMPMDPMDAEDDENVSPDQLASFEIRDLGEPNNMFVVRPQSYVPGEPLAKSGGPGSERQLDAELLQKVKRATAYLSVRRPDGGGEGSGFACFEKGYIFTNAHVVGMTNPNSASPISVEVVMNSGEANERRFNGRVLAVDRSRDLAVIRITGANLPEPLPLVSSNTLQETQPVFVIGFPFGSSLGKNVTVSPSSISSLRREGGALVRLQLAGGMNPGNSGGPVVDAEGRVVGVSVAGIANTGINFAVPADFVFGLFHGTASQMFGLTPTRAPDGVHMPVCIALFDPLNRIKQVSVDCWIGDTGPQRPGSTTPPKTQSGDGERRTHALTITARAAQGDLTLPPLPEGKTYWLQICLEEGDERHKRWLSAHPCQPKAFLEPTTAVVANNDVSNARVEFLARSRFQMRMQRGDNQYAMHFRQKWAEKSNGDSLLRTISQCDLGFRAAERPIPKRGLNQLMMSRSQNVMGDQSERPDVSQLGTTEQRWQAGMDGTLTRWLAALDLQLPDMDLARKKEWKQSQPLPLEFVIGIQTENKMDLVYRYLGTQEQKGRRIAVVGLSGDLVKENTRNTGTLYGQAQFDLATGRVIAVQAILDAEIEAASASFFVGNLFEVNQSSVSGTWEFRLRRTFDGSGAE